MTIKDPKTVIRNLYQRHLQRKDNVIFANKLFVINSVVAYVFGGKSYREVDKAQLVVYGEYIHRYLQDELDIYWEDGKLIIRDLQTGEHFTGG